MKRILIAIIAVFLLSNFAFADIMDNFINDERWSNGRHWGEYQGSKLSNVWSTGSASYVADFVKYCFSKNDIYSGEKFFNTNEIKPGDILCFKPENQGWHVQSLHWVCVIKREENLLYTAEGNWAGVISVGFNYTIVQDQLHRNGMQFRTFSCGYHYN